MAASSSSNKKRQLYQEKEEKEEEIEYVRKTRPDSTNNDRETGFLYAGDKAVEYLQQVFNQGALKLYDNISPSSDLGFFEMAMRELLPNHGSQLKTPASTVFRNTIKAPFKFECSLAQLKLGSARFSQKALTQVCTRAMLIADAPKGIEYELNRMIVESVAVEQEEDDAMRTTFPFEVMVGCSEQQIAIQEALDGDDTGEIVEQVRTVGENAAVALDDEKEDARFFLLSVPPAGMPLRPHMHGKKPMIGPVGKLHPDVYTNSGGLFDEKDLTVGVYENVATNQVIFSLRHFTFALLRATGANLLSRYIKSDNYMAGNAETRKIIAMDKQRFELLKKYYAFPAITSMPYRNPDQVIFDISLHAHQYNEYIVNRTTQKLEHRADPSITYDCDVSRYVTFTAYITYAFFASPLANRVLPYGPFNDYTHSWKAEFVGTVAEEQKKLDQLMGEIDLLRSAELADDSFKYLGKLALTSQ